MSDNELPVVEMHPAYEWTCEECGRNSFVSCIVCELTHEDRIDQARHMGLIDEFSETVPDELQGEFVSYPESVTCPHCGAEFRTKHIREDEDV